MSHLLRKFYMINKGFKIGTLIYYITDSGIKVWGRVVTLEEYMNGRILRFTSINDHIKMLKTERAKDKPVLIRFYKPQSLKFGHYGWCSAKSLKKATKTEEVLYGY